MAKAQREHRERSLRGKRSRCIISGVDREAEGDCNSITMQILQVVQEFRMFSDFDGGWCKRKEFVCAKICREAENSTNAVRKVFQQDVEVFRIFDCDESSWRKGARRHDGSRAFR
ncbi:hypothetical protein V5799_017034 [Amblyomma americanum]|uniref:Uncharacterized protein n=1 Tax=Amblyomma americanum TaxID=6943 RepID=A0AAQ4F4F4_AMBAM